MKALYICLKYNIKLENASSFAWKIFLVYNLWINIFFTAPNVLNYMYNYSNMLIQNMERNVVSNNFRSDT